MDKNFQYFLDQMGPEVDKREVPAKSIERYRGRLPDQLLSYWKESGWCGYADGLFWTVDPEEYEPVLEAWIGDTEFMQKDAYHVIARSAFGELYLWGENTGGSLNVFAPGSFCVPDVLPDASNVSMDVKIQAFFVGQDRDDNDFEDLFAPALKKLGPLRHEEMYGFVPAMALGGPGTLKTLEKVKAIEHLVLLAQLAPLEVITSPPF